MKKIILLSLLVLVSVTASARKSYITVYAHPSANYYTINMNGDVPSGIPNVNYGTHGCYITDTYTIGEVLNILSEYGYEVELMAPNGVGDKDFRVHYLLSKEIPSNQTQMKGDVNEDNSVNISDVNEVISLILGKLREHPEILEQIKK